MSFLRQPEGLITSVPVCVLLLAVLTASSGCHRLKEPESNLDFADTSTASQLLSGFSWLESKSWRWTAREFSAALKPPDDAETRGATLYLHLFIPDSQIKMLGPMTLTATTDGHALPPETFSQGGTYIYARDIPKEVMATSVLPIKFSFDKACPKEKSDGRELGAIVTGIELQAN